MEKGSLKALLGTTQQVISTDRGFVMLRPDHRFTDDDINRGFKRSEVRIVFLTYDGLGFYEETSIKNEGFYAFVVTHLWNRQYDNTHGLTSIIDKLRNRR